MARKHHGEISPGKAARLIGCTVETVRRWCQLALSGRDSRLRLVRRDPVGRYWVQRSEIEEIRSSERATWDTGDPGEP